MSEARRTSRTTVAAWAALFPALVSPGAAAERPAAGTSPLEAVQRYADTMLEHGRDSYGPLKSRLFLSALDRETLAPLKDIPPAPEGIRKGDRVGGRGAPLVGCNPQLDENFLRVLYSLSEITGAPRYRQAADEAIDWFLRNTLSPETDLLAWGEHLFWDPMADKPHSEHELPVHEFSRPWVLWDRVYLLAPEHGRRFALGLWKHQIADPATGAFDRHAPYWKHGPTDGMDFPRHGGFYIGTWAAAYAHTKDEMFLKAIEAVLGRFERKRHPQTGFINMVGNDPFAVLPTTLSLTIDCASAAALVPDPLKSRLVTFAEREDHLFCGLPHDPKGKGFVNKVDRETGQPSAAEKWGATHTPLWDMKYGGGATTAGMAMLCAARYEQTSRKKYWEYVVAAADAYLDALPPEDADTWPMAYGHAISVEMAAFRWTGTDVYLARARALARRAIEIYWQDRPLPRASARTQHYETIAGVDTLALALLEVHAAVHHLAVRVPLNVIDR